MTKEQLLIPRMKLLGNYPGKPHALEIGRIIMLDKFGASKWWHEYTDEEPFHLEEGSNQYPLLFRKMEWHEDRELSDMPEYVKNKDGVVVVFKTALDVAKQMKIVDSFLHQSIPATQEEYDSFIQNKQP